MAKLVAAACATSERNEAWSGREPGERDGKERRHDKERAKRNDDAVEHLDPADCRVRPPPAGACRGALGRPPSEPEDRQRQHQADRHLQQREQGRAREIDVEAHELVDRDLKRCRARAAAEREHDGEAREAEEEHDRGDRRRFASEDREIEDPEDRPRRHAKLRGEPPMLPGNGGERGEEDARGERRIEEDVRDENAREPVEPAAHVDPEQPEPLACPA